MLDFLGGFGLAMGSQLRKTTVITMPLGQYDNDFYFEKWKLRLHANFTELGNISDSTVSSIYPKST